MTTSQSICKTEYIPNQEENNTNLAITDSGATDNMSSHQNFFEYILPMDNGNEVILGDDTTKLEIKGYGMMNIFINTKRVRFMGYYVPKLGTTLISIKHHMKFQGHYFHAESNMVVLAYDKDILYPDCNTEFTLLVQPASTSNEPFIFNECKAEKIH